VSNGRGEGRLAVLSADADKRRVEPPPPLPVLGVKPHPAEDARRTEYLPVLEPEPLPGPLALAVPQRLDELHGHRRLFVVKPDVPLTLRLQVPDVPLHGQPNQPAHDNLARQYTVHVPAHSRQRAGEQFGFGCGCHASFASL